MLLAAFREAGWTKGEERTAERLANAERFQAALAALRRGDFTASAPLFAEHTLSRPCPIVRWLQEGWFREAPDALSEALTCACFLGETDVARVLLAQGLDPQGGSATGLNALHWATNRGQIECVRMLLERHPPLEARNMYGGTILSGTVWSAIHEPRPAHVEIIEELLEAGANVDAVEYPTGTEVVDRVLERYGAKRRAQG
jgi:ankyrin repeat protein